MERYLDTSFTPKERAKDLLSRMDLTEKTRQLGCTMILPMLPIERQDLKGGIGAATVMGSEDLPDDIRKLQDYIMDHSPHHIPALFHSEALAGTVAVPGANQYPISIGLGATFSPEIVPELQKENALCTEYSKLLASAQIEFDGGVYTLSQMTPFKQSSDDAKRLAAWKAEGAWYMSHADKLDSIYDELVHLRDTMGKKLGNSDYIPLGYDRMQRNCYTKEDVEAFRKAVVKHIVPLADAVYRRQAERLGKAYPMNYADNALEFRSGNPKPQGTPDDILAAGRKFYHELSGETAEFIDFMYDNELLDVLSRKGKAGGGYCTTLGSYNCPFIFANFNGTSGDVEVITHEAGHAFANFTGRFIVPSECQWPSLEACEVHSMSMEFFAWPWAEYFFGSDARKFRYTHLSGALTFIPYGTMVDHFQHLVYEKPDMTPAERNDAWRELTAIYMPWMKLDDIPFYGEGRAWQRQHHIYESPFYYIDYCLAQTVSLQFWAEIQKDSKAAWEKYMAYTRPAGTKTFKELVAGAGLDSPFGEEAMKTIS